MGKKAVSLGKGEEVGCGLRPEGKVRVLLLAGGLCPPATLTLRPARKGYPSWERQNGRPS